MYSNIDRYTINNIYHWYNRAKERKDGQIMLTMENAIKNAIYGISSGSFVFDDSRLHGKFDQKLCDKFNVIETWSMSEITHYVNSGDPDVPKFLVYKPHRINLVDDVNALEKAIDIDEYLITVIDLPHDALIRAVDRNPRLLSYIEDQPDDLCLTAIRSNPLALQYVKNQTYEMCTLAVKQSAYAIQYVKDQTEELCLLAIRSVPITIGLIRNQTITVCKEAISRNPYLIWLIKDQTDELSMMAVNINGLTLSKVRNKTFEICEAAVKNVPNAIEYVPKHLYGYDKLAAMAVESDPDCIRLIPKTLQTEQMAYDAICGNAENIMWISKDCLTGKIVSKCIELYDEMPEVLGDFVHIADK